MDEERAPDNVETGEPAAGDDAVAEDATDAAVEPAPTPEAAPEPDPAPETPASFKLPPMDLDTALTAVMWSLVTLVLAVGVLFAWTVYSDRQAERGATPATRALLDLEQLVRSDPQNANARVRYGEALGAAGLVDQAIEQLSAALELNPEHTGAMLDLGILAMQKKEYRTAEGYFQKVLDLSEGQEFEFINERRELALFYLGEIALTEKRYEDSIPFYKAALRIRRDASDTYLELALAYRGTGNDKAAKKQLDIALTFDPSLAQAQYEMGDILLAEGDEVKAAFHLGRAYQLAPENQQAAEAVAKMGPVEKRMAAAEDALEAGDKPTAVKEAKIAFSLDPVNFDAALLLGRILEADGQKTDAVNAYGDANTLRPNDPQVVEALDRLKGK